MSGTTIIGALLGASAPLLAKVQADLIKAGRLPDDAALPALLVKSTSTVERKKLVRTGKVRMTERISVTLRTQNYRDQGSIIKLVRNACAGRTGTIAGVNSVAVTAAGTGPDMLGPTNTFERTQDFMVGYDEPITEPTTELPGGTGTLDFTDPNNSGLLALFMEAA